MLYVVIGIIIAAIVVYLFCLYPGRNRNNLMKPFQQVYIAHRGLFDNKTDYPENSLPAFIRAVEFGYGIELDVQMTTDGVLVVFHDENLNRMCGTDKRVVDCTYRELLEYKLMSSGQSIPTFDSVLDVIAGKVPLIVEVKSEGDWKKTTELVAERLKAYNGIYCMESFHPLAVERFKELMPNIARGQLSMNYFNNRPHMPFFSKFALTNLLLNFRARPDFIAFNHTQANLFSFRLCCMLYNVTPVAWTIRSQEQLKKARKVFSVIIFDSFIPSDN